jgi:hypothetical protein
MTDGLTKALSHLGFSADVFLGRFDDNKYVADLKKEFGQDAPGAPESTPPKKSTRKPLPEKTSSQGESGASEGLEGSLKAAYEAVSEVWNDCAQRTTEQYANDLLATVTAFKGDKGSFDGFETLDDLRAYCESGKMTVKWCWKIKYSLAEAVEEI